MEDGGCRKALDAKIKILFVVDDESIRRLFCRAMKDDPLMIETASDGEKALEKRKTFSAEIVISDVRMPEIDDLTLLGGSLLGQTIQFSWN